MQPQQPRGGAVPLPLPGGIQAPQPAPGVGVPAPAPTAIPGAPPGAPPGVLPATDPTAALPLEPAGGPLDPRINPELGEFGSLMEPWEREFRAPSIEEMMMDPGYQFRLQEGLDAIQHSAAARGGITTGATLEDLTRYSQGLASTEYGAAYGRTRDEYESAYRTFQQNQMNQYNRLMGISGMGQQATGQYGQAGQFAAGNAANIYGQSAGQIGSSYQNEATARASGIAGQANAYMGGLQGVGGTIQDMMRMKYLNEPDYGPVYGSPPPNIMGPRV